MELLTQIINIVGSDNVRTDEPMSLHTTFRAGGNAAYFVTPENENQLSELLKMCPKYYVIGRGSNLLVRDEGYNGVIIHLGKYFSDIKLSQQKPVSKVSDSAEAPSADIPAGIIAGAGAKLSDIATFAMKNSLTGFEFAHGIPGCLGGALVMNAGAYDGEIKNVLKSARLMAPDGSIVIKNAEELELGYRHSNITDDKLTVLSAELSLMPGEISAIEKKMKELAEKRREKQPLEFASAGSTFKRPEGHFAGQLIQEAGLKGFNVGQAQVSEKHAGFVINKGGATAGEIIELIETVQNKVLETSGVRLETEVRIIGG